MCKTKQWGRYTKLALFQLLLLMCTAMIPSHFYLSDAIKLLLHWRLYYLAVKLYQKFGISESAMARLIKWDLKMVYK